MANPENLIPMASRTPAERSAISSKGGKATKGITKWKLKTCKLCKLPCPYKDTRSEKGLRCKVPDLKRRFLESASSKEAMMESLIMDAHELGLSAKTHTQRVSSYKAKLDLKKEIYPNKQELEIKQEIKEVIPKDEIEEIAKGLIKDACDIKTSSKGNAKAKKQSKAP